MWIAQRATAAVLALCVVVHLATMIAAVRGGLSATGHPGRTRGSVAWAGFYGAFVLAVAIHAPIGLRTVAGEWLQWRGRAADVCCVANQRIVASAGVARGRRGHAMKPRRIQGHDHPAYWASIVHRVLLGILLAVFLPLHFAALGMALSGDASLDGFLAWTDRPWVKASEVALVALLAAHLTGGLRLLLIEFVGWKRQSQGWLLALAGSSAPPAARLRSR